MAWSFTINPIDFFKEKVTTILEEKNFYLKHYLSAETLDPARMTDQYLGYAEKLAPHVVNISIVMNQARVNGYCHNWGSNGLRYIVFMDKIFTANL